MYERVLKYNGSKRMTLTAKQLLTLADSGTIGRIGSQDGFTPRGSLRIGRLFAALTPECIRIQKVRNAAFTDDNSVPVTGSPGSRIAKTAIHQDAIEESLAEMLAEQIELEISPLTLDDLKGGKLTPADVTALGTLLIEKAQP